MSFPRAIVLNGCSSSGKTSIARELQNRLPQQYVNFSIDSILDGLPSEDRAAMQTGNVITRAGYDWRSLVRAYHYAIPGLLQAGLHLILDNAWCEADDIRELLAELAGYPVWLVGVRCELAELQRREVTRGDRATGLANWEYPRVHTFMTYDIEIDSSAIWPRQIAENLSSAILALQSEWGRGAVETMERLAAS